MITTPREYFNLVSKFDKYPNSEKPNIYFIGLAGETGELTKALADVKPFGGDSESIEKETNILKSEIGDVLWYWFALAKSLDIDYNNIWLDVSYEQRKTHINHIPLETILLLVSHVGRLMEHLKKSIRDDKGIITKERKNKIEQELADTLWHIMLFIKQFEFTPMEILELNYEKLYARNKAGTIHGEGEGIRINRK